MHELVGAFFTNTCLSALHSIYMNKFDKKSLEAVAMMKKAQADADAKKLAAEAAAAKSANEPKKGGPSKKGRR